MPVTRDKDTKKLDVSILGGNSGRAISGDPMTRWHILEDKTVQLFRTEYWGPSILTENLLTRIEQREYRLDMGELVRFKGAPPNKFFNWGFVENDTDIQELKDWEAVQINNANTLQEHRGDFVKEFDKNFDNTDVRLTAVDKALGISPKLPLKSLTNRKTISTHGKKSVTGNETFPPDALLKALQNDDLHNLNKMEILP
ncbi:unnamed protein product [Gordionus sp. m RMFG-2023]